MFLAIFFFLFTAFFAHAGSSKARIDPSQSAPDLIAKTLAEASRRFAIQERLLRAVMHIESGGQVRALSDKGAICLMQIMPKTYAARMF